MKNIKNLETPFGSRPCSFRARVEEKRAEREFERDAHECRMRRHCRLYDRLADMRGVGAEHQAAQEVLRVY